MKIKIKCVTLHPIMRHLTSIFAFLCGILMSYDVSAQHIRTESVADSTLTISLLTCSPGHEAYELYGHTALLVESRQSATAVVYNYGVFDFEAPHFLWRFILGKCDYLLCPQRMDAFLYQYAERGSSVVKQVLNLTQAEAARMDSALRKEAELENRVYRYHIFRNNCTTRARDLIERCIDGEVVYPIRAPRHTFRSMLHTYTKGCDWVREGTDLLLGTDVDTLLTERDEQFAPLYMMAYADSAFIDRGLRRYSPMVRERVVLLAENPARQQIDAARQFSFPLSPSAFAWGLLALGLLLAIYECWRRRVVWPVDVLLLTLQGVVGVLLTFMALFSVHPAVASNWQVWVFNPLPLFFVYPVMKAARQRQFHVYHVFAAAFLTLFILFSFFIPQHFSILTRPLVLLLLSRALVHIFIFKFSHYRTHNIPS